MKRYITVGLVFLCLSACATDAAKTQYYHLPNSHFIPPLEIANTIEVKVNVADYLSSSSIAIGSYDGNSIVMTSNHLWAESLDKEIQNNLSNKLNKLGRSIGNYFSVYPNQRESEKLEIVIEKFQGNLDGMVEIAGHANLLDYKNNIKNSMAFQKKIVQQKSGYQSMVEAMDQALTKVARQIYTIF